MKHFIELEMEIGKVADENISFDDIDKLLFHFEQSCKSLGFYISKLNRAIGSRFDSDSELVSKEDILLEE